MEFKEFIDGEQISFSHYPNNYEPGEIILKYHQNGVYTGRHEWEDSDITKDEYGEEDYFYLSCSMNIKAKVLFKDRNLLVLKIKTQTYGSAWPYPKESYERKDQCFFVIDRQTNSKLRHWGTKSILIQLQNEKSYVIGRVDRNSFVLQKKITEKEFFEGLFAIVTSSLDSWPMTLSYFVADLATNKNIVSYFLNNKKEAFG